MAELKRQAPQLVPYHFQPGQSGNPGGVSTEMAEGRRKLRAFFPEAIDRMIKLARTARNEKVRFQALQCIIERVAGKPLQPLVSVDSETVRYDAKVILDRLEAIAAEAKQEPTD